MQFRWTTTIEDKRDLMEQMYEVDLAAEAQGVELPEDWRDGFSHIDVYEIDLVFDTETGDVTIEAARRG